jgi:hypothetical protein
MEETRNAIFTTYFSAERFLSAPEHPFSSLSIGYGDVAGA